MRIGEVKIMAPMFYTEEFGGLMVDQGRRLVTENRGYATSRNYINTN
jgi:hypothetical protein